MSRVGRNCIRYIHLCGTALSPSAERTVAARCLTPFRYQTGNSKLHRTFSATATILQDGRRRRKPLSEATKPFKRPNRGNRDEEESLGEKEQILEDHMKTLMENTHPSSTRKARKMERTHAVMAFLQSWKNLKALRSEYDRGYEAQSKAESLDDPHVEGFVSKKGPASKAISGIDALLSDFMKAWRLYTFGPICEVGILARLYFAAGIFLLVPPLGLARTLMAFLLFSARRVRGIGLKFKK